MKARSVDQRRYSASLLLAGALAIALVGTAWACTTSPTITPEESSGIAGTSVTIDASFTPFGKSYSGMPAPAGLVEVRWDSAEGAVIGTGSPGEPAVGQSSNLSIPVTIPAEAAPGHYYLVAIQRDLKGTVIAKASETFEVTGSARRSPANAGGRAATAQDLWSGFGEGTSTGGSAPATGPESRPLPVLLGAALLTVGAIGLLGSVAVFRRKTEATASGRN